MSDSTTLECPFCRPPSGCVLAENALAVAIVMQRYVCRCVPRNNVRHNTARHIV